MKGSDEAYDTRANTADATQIAVQPPRRRVELYRGGDRVGDVGTAWPRTTNHRAVMLAPAEQAGIRSARMGLEFTTAEGRMVMLFAGANDTLIISEE